MKNLTSICLSVIFAFGLMTSNSYSQETLFGNGDLELGGFGGPVVKFTQVKDEFGVFVGGRGALAINKSFAIGGGGYGLATQNITDIIDNTDVFLEMGYGGITLEYINNSDELIHFFALTGLYAGSMTFVEDYHHMDEIDWERKRFGDDTFYIIEPEIAVELNLTKWFKLGVGAGYRFAMEVDEFNDYDIYNEDISGFSGNLTFKFGGGF